MSEKNDDALNIDWITYDETNLTAFKVDRSLDGHQFTTVGKVAASNSHNKENYTWTDNSPLTGISFYRIEAVDIDGMPEYSNVVRVDRTTTNYSRLTLFPNPVTDKRVSIQVGNMDKGIYKLTISDIAGRTIYTQDLDHPGGMLSQMIQLPTSVSKGIYSISLCSNSSKFLKQVLVE